MPVLITGCARSGTSLTTGILEACGLDLGRGKVNDNKEAVDVRDKLVKPYLKSIGADPLGQYPLPYQVKRDPLWFARVHAMLGRPDEPWGYKGAKLCLIWGLWANAFPDATYVIVRRDRERIIDSCLRTSFMRAHTTRAGWADWVDHHLACFEQMRNHLYCIEVWPDTNPDTFKPLVKMCGLEWNPRAEKVIKPGKWHGD